MQQAQHLEIANSLLEMYKLYSQQKKDSQTYKQREKWIELILEVQHLRQQVEDHKDRFESEQRKKILAEMLRDKYLIENQYLKQENDLLTGSRKSLSQSKQAIKKQNKQYLQKLNNQIKQLQSEKQKLCKQMQQLDNEKQRKVNQLNQQMKKLNQQIKKKNNDFSIQKQQNEKLLSQSIKLKKYMVEKFDCRDKDLQAHKFYLLVDNTADIIKKKQLQLKQIQQILRKNKVYEQHKNKLELKKILEKIIQTQIQQYQTKQKYISQLQSKFNTILNKYQQQKQQQQENHYGEDLQKKLGQTLQYMTAKYISLQDQYEKQKQQNSKQIQTKEKQILKLKEELSTKLERQKKLEKINLQIQKKLNLIQNNLNNANQKIEDLKSLNLDLEKNKNRLDNQLNSKIAQINKLNQTKEDQLWMKKKIGDLQLESKSKQNMVEEQRLINEKLKNQIKQKNKQLEQLQQKILKINLQMATVKSKQTQDNQKNNTFFTSIQNLQKQLTIIKNKLQSQQKDHLKTKQQLQRIQLKNSSMEQRFKERKQCFQESEQEFSRIKKNLIYKANEHIEHIGKQKQLKIGSIDEAIEYITNYLKSSVQSKQFQPKKQKVQEMSQAPIQKIQSLFYVQSLGYGFQNIDWVRTTLTQQIGCANINSKFLVRTEIVKDFEKYLSFPNVLMICLTPKKKTFAILIGQLSKSPQNNEPVLIFESDTLSKYPSETRKIIKGLKPVMIKDSTKQLFLGKQQIIIAKSLQVTLNANGDYFGIKNKKALFGIEETETKFEIQTIEMHQILS